MSPIFGYLASCVNDVLGWTILVSEAKFQDICRQQKLLMEFEISSHHFTLFTTQAWEQTDPKTVGTKIRVGLKNDPLFPGLKIFFPKNESKL